MVSKARSDGTFVPDPPTHCHPSLNPTGGHPARSLGDRDRLFRGGDRCREKATGRLDRQPTAMQAAPDRPIGEPGAEEPAELQRNGWLSANAAEVALKAYHWQKTSAGGS